MPQLSKHMAKHGIDVSLVTINWFLTIFADALPTEVSMYNVRTCIHAPMCAPVHLDVAATWVKLCGVRLCDCAYLICLLHVLPPPTHHFRLLSECGTCFYWMAE